MPGTGPPLVGMGPGRPPLVGMGPGRRAPPPPDDLGLHVVEGDGDTGRLSLHHIHDVWLVQHSGRLLQGRAWGEEILRTHCSSNPPHRPVSSIATDEEAEARSRLALCLGAAQLV